MSNCVTSLTLNRQITLGNLLYCLREGQRVGDNVRTIKRNASLIIGNLVNARINRVDNEAVCSCYAIMEVANAIFLCGFDLNRSLTKTINLLW